MQTGRKARVWKLFSTLMIFTLFVAFASAVCADQFELDRVKSAIQEKGARWVAGETSVSILPDEEKARRVGLIKPFNLDFHGLQALPENSGLEAVALPVSLDWRDHGGNFVTPVRNQKSCGSCWAFATTAALEANVLISQNKPGFDLNLSEQVLVSCSGAGSCNGGVLEYSTDYIQEYGLPLETCFPYSATDQACAVACGTYMSDTYKIINYYRVAGYSAPSVETLKSALYNYGPLVTAMDVYNDFFNYRGGVYSYTTGSYAGGHAVLLVGYDDLNRCFIVKNSWGTGWGELGYFRISYNELTSLVGFGQPTIAYVGSGSPQPQPCSYSISPAGRNQPYTAAYATITVLAGSGCSWTAVSNASSWIIIRSGKSGVGNGSVRCYIYPNRSTSPRTGTVTIAGQTFTVTQSGRTVRVR